MTQLMVATKRILVQFLVMIKSFAQMIAVIPMEIVLTHPGMAIVMTILIAP
jgi:hypothetical protein